MMKFLVIFLLIVALVILIGLFIMSAKLLKHAQKQSSASNFKSKEANKDAE